MQLSSQEPGESEGLRMLSEVDDVTDDGKRNQKGQRSGYVIMDILYKTRLLSSIGNPRGATAFIRIAVGTSGILINAVARNVGRKCFCEPGMLVGNAFIEQGSLIAVGMLGY